jgi:hypothetical protein
LQQFLASERTDQPVASGERVEVQPHGEGLLGREDAGDRGCVHVAEGPAQVVRGKARAVEQVEDPVMPDARIGVLTGTGLGDITTLPSWSS